MHKIYRKKHRKRHIHIHTYTQKMRQTEMQACNLQSQPRKIIACGSQGLGRVTRKGGREEGRRAMAKREWV